MKGVSVLSKERLTEWYDGRAFCPQSIKCAPMCDSCDHMGKMMDKLAKYEELEEQGLLLRLPCKVGDTVWKIVYECEEDYAECLVSCNTCHIRRLGIEETKFTIDMIDDVGNWFFLTQSEAEEKLRELNKESEE